MIDKNKTCTTREGREVRIYATDGAGDYPVHGAVKCEKGWYLDCWTRDGLCRIASQDKNDLVEIDVEDKS